MAKILCPNKQYSGISASVTFVNGVGETENENLIAWFKAKGYKVEEAEADQDPEGSGEEVKLEEMTAEELKAYAEENGIDIGKATSQEGILKKIEEATE
jgi:hypothetical protein